MQARPTPTIGLQIVLLMARRFEKRRSLPVRSFVLRCTSRRPKMFKVAAIHVQQLCLAGTATKPRRTDMLVRPGPVSMSLESYHQRLWLRPRPQDPRPKKKTPPQMSSMLCMASGSSRSSLISIKPIPPLALSLSFNQAARSKQSDFLWPYLLRNPHSPLKYVALFPESPILRRFCLRRLPGSLSFLPDLPNLAFSTSSCAWLYPSCPSRRSRRRPWGRRP